MKIIAAVPNNIRFFWETAVYLNSLKKWGYTKDANILVFLPDTPTEKTKINEWLILEKKFPEVNFQYFEDKHKITRLMGIFHYIPLFRKYVLQEFWKQHPELKDEMIVYTDTDVIFNSYLDFSKYENDDVNYVSWTGDKDRTDNYLWQPYFDGKIAQVDERKLEGYKKGDVLNECGKICKINREIITANNSNTGGAQYILKNIDTQFWTDCFNRILEMKTYLANINQIYMQGNTPQEKENNGFQSWCSDMWVVLYTLWGRGAATSCPKELDFAWTTDNIERLEDISIIHNAGATSDSKMKIPHKDEYLEIPIFFKGNYNNKTPFDYTEQEYLNTIVNHPIASKYCNSIYVKEILETKSNLNL